MRPRHLPLHRRLLGAALAAALAAVPASTTWAADSVLSLVNGPSEADRLDFTLDELEALPQVTIVTENEYSDGLVTYRGPLVRDVLDHLALGDATTVRFTAANDYFVDIPTSDFRRYNAILALEADGERLSRRDKGPLWLMYPITDHSELRSPVYNARLIWQVVRIEAL